MERRNFIKTTAAASLAFAYAAQSGDSKAKLAKRRFGKTADYLSVIGFGGIVVKDAEQSHANQIVAHAVDRGVNYFDVAPSYGDAEDKLGPALEPYRDRCFLACKTYQRDKQGAENELHASLKKLRTDRFDLYQLHALSQMEDLEKAFGQNGAMETIVKAKQDGKIRYLGFSAHSAEVALAAMERFDFDSILFPFNFVCWHEGNFGPQVLEKAKEKNVARLALKAMAFSPWPDKAIREPYEKCWYKPVSVDFMAEYALRFTLSLDITAAIPPGEEDLFVKAVEIAERFKPLTQQEHEHVQSLSHGVPPIFTA